MAAKRIIGIRTGYVVNRNAKCNSLLRKYSQQKYFKINPFGSHVMRKSIVLLMAVLVVIPAAVWSGEEDEAGFKARFIIDLIDNVELSKDSKLSDAEEVVIYILGESPVYDRLKEMAESAAEKGRKIRIETVSFSDDLNASHILFLPSSDPSDLARALKKLNGSKTVTVADGEDFARYGAMISFFEDEKESELRYEVNRLVLDSTGIHLSSKLMDKAELI